MSYLALSQSLEKLLQGLPPHPIDEQELNGLVSSTISESSDRSSFDNRKSQWEFLLKDEVFRLAETEGGSNSYFDALWDRLDIILTFTDSLKDSRAPDWAIVVGRENVDCKDQNVL